MTGAEAYWVIVGEVATLKLSDPTRSAQSVNSKGPQYSSKSNSIFISLVCLPHLLKSVTPASSALIMAWVD